MMFKSDKSNLNADVTAHKSSCDQECQDGVWAVGFFVYSYVLWINIFILIQILKKNRFYV